jgi:hypothetical protein
MAERAQPAPARGGRATSWLLAVLSLVTLAWLVLPATASSASTSAPLVGTTAANPQPVEITLYWGLTCPKCEEEREWLAEVAGRYPIVLTEYEVWENAANRERFIAAGEDLGFEASAVPVTVIDRRVWIGYTDSIADDIEAAIGLAAAGEPVPPGVYGTPGAGTCSDDELLCDPGDTGASITVPFVGEVALDGRSLLVSTLIIGFVDGVNPCSLWVISVLLTIVVRTASRRRVVAIGFTFLVVTAAMYALYMAGIYSALTVVGFLGVIQVVVAIAAAIFGVVSIKDYFAFKQGLSFTIADSAKPGIYRRVREAAGHHKLVPALLATVALGVAVSLLETPCTAGFPVLWAGLLQANNVGFAEAAGLFIAYMIPFLLDEMIVFGIAVATMRAAKLQEKHGELLKLFAGVTMVVLAAVMAFDPQLMESPVIALALFAAAFAAAAVVHLVTTRVRRTHADRAAEGASTDDAPTDESSEPAEL